MENPVTIAVTLALLTGGTVYSAENVQAERDAIVQQIEEDIIAPRAEMDLLLAEIRSGFGN